MPKYCFNTLFLESDSIETLQSFYKDNYKDDKQHISFDKLVPVKKENDNTSNQSECCELWGTKTDACFSTFAYDNYERLTYEFSTIDSPPTTWLHKIAQLYPNICFLIEYSEIKNDFWGKQIYVEGLMIDEECESLGAHNWKLCDKTLLYKIINDDIDNHILTKENYLLRIDNILDDYIFESRKTYKNMVDDYVFESRKPYKNIDLYVEKLVEKRLSVI